MCIMSLISESGDMNLKTYSVVYRTSGPYSLKLTVSREKKLWAI